MQDLEQASFEFTGQSYHYRELVLAIKACYSRDYIRPKKTRQCILVSVCAKNPICLQYTPIKEPHFTEESHQAM